VPDGNVTTYGEIAAAIGDARASRAVGNAVGSNPISYLIPCHRVIRATGELGGYAWGPERKKVMLTLESLRADAWRERRTGFRPLARTPATPLFARPA
jgi:AraC family transcriptional regulator of adaptative response/methylated-DNA-[protein]-cysteine methyltransferase